MKGILWSYSMLAAIGSSSYPFWVELSRMIILAGLRNLPSCQSQYCQVLRKFVKGLKAPRWEFRAPSRMADSSSWFFCHGSFCHLKYSCRLSNGFFTPFSANRARNARSLASRSGLIVGLGVVVVIRVVAVPDGAAEPFPPFLLQPSEFPGI